MRDLQGFMADLISELNPENFFIQLMNKNKKWKNGEKGP